MVEGAVPPQRKRDRFKAGMKRYMTVPFVVRTSDLPRRAASAVVMLAVAGGALWAGGWLWAVFVVLVGLGVLWEWSRLVSGMKRHRPTSRPLWMIAGIVYICGATAVLIWLRTMSGPDGENPLGLFMIGLIVGAVIAVDVGAYFSGRTFGGPKIAPRISPSKTWAGLIGGAVMAVVFIYGWYAVWEAPATPGFEVFALVAGTVLAVVAQAGDFFESWMKRQAGVKDSSAFIPGHGGLFDRVDGLMAVLFAFGVYGLLFVANTGGIYS